MLSMHTGIAIWCHCWKKLVIHQTVYYCPLASNLSYELNVNMVRMRNHCQPVCVIPRVWLSMPNWVLEPGIVIMSKKSWRVVQPDVLEKGGEEDEEVVLGERLPHADSSPKTKWNKLLLLHKAPAPLKRLKKSLRPAKGRIEKILHLEQNFAWQTDM